MTRMQEAIEQFKRIDSTDSPRLCRERNFPCPPVRFHEHSPTMKKPLGFIWAHLSMNRPLTPSLSPSDGERVAEGRVRGGSWSQCVRKSESGLSMNRAPSPHPSPPMGERVAEGRVRGQIHGSGVDAARSRYFLFSCCPVARHHNPRQPLRVSSLSIRTRSL